MAEVRRAAEAFLEAVLALVARRPVGRVRLVQVANLLLLGTEVERLGLVSVLN